MFDVSKMVDAVLSAVDKPIAALAGRVRALEDRKQVSSEEVAALVRQEIDPVLADIREAIAETPEAPELPDIPAMVAEVVKEEIAAMPPAERGEPGDPGKDADPTEVARHLLPEVEKAVSGLPGMVAEAVKAEVAQIPPPERGEPGDKGEPGDPGRDGKDVDQDEIAALVGEKVSDAVAAIPLPKDGAPGVDGKDGVGMAGAMIDREGRLVVTLTDGTARELGCIVGKDGAPGEPGKDGLDGKDGLGFDNLEVAHDGARGFCFRFVRGEQTKEFKFSIPAVLDCGVWNEEREGGYAKGDGVTYGGSFWIAQTDMPSGRPDGTSKDWRLAVKRGRDGKDGIAKEKKDPPPVRGFPGKKKPEEGSEG